VLAEALTDALFLSRPQFVPDSLLEGDGFELQVPRQIGNALRLRSNVTDAAGRSGPSSQARLSRPPEERLVVGGRGGSDRHERRAAALLAQ
jgi:hypothetical protein